MHRPILDWTTVKSTYDPGIKSDSKLSRLPAIDPASRMDPPRLTPLLLRTYVRSRRWARAVIYSGSNLNKEHGTPAEECSHSSSFFYNTSYKRPARRERNKWCNAAITLYTFYATLIAAFE